MAKRGPKPEERRLPAEPLAVSPPRGMKGRARALYLALAEDLAVEGYASRCDQRLVELAARAAELVERLEREVSALASLITVGSTGQEKVHPLVGELRAQRRELASLLGMLLLSPRSRSASRLTEEAARLARGRADIPEGEDARRVLSLLG